MQFESGYVDPVVPAAHITDLEGGTVHSEATHIDLSHTVKPEWPSPTQKHKSLPLHTGSELVDTHKHAGPLHAGNSRPPTDRISTHAEDSTAHPEVTLTAIPVLLTPILLMTPVDERRGHSSKWTSRTDGLQLISS